MVEQFRTEGAKMAITVFRHSADMKVIDTGEGYLIDFKDRLGD